LCVDPVEGSNDGAKFCFKFKSLFWRHVNVGNGVDWMA